MLITVLLCRITCRSLTGVFLCQGVHDDGDIYNEDNLVEFRRHVLELTDDKGVHFVMADGVSFERFNHCEALFLP